MRAKKNDIMVTTIAIKNMFIKHMIAFWLITRDSVVKEVKVAVSHVDLTTEGSMQTRKMILHLA